MGSPETRKTEIHSTSILSESEIYPTYILPEPEYTRSVFYPSVRIDRSNGNTFCNQKRKVQSIQPPKKNVSLLTEIRYLYMNLFKSVSLKYNPFGCYYYLRPSFIANFEVADIKTRVNGYETFLLTTNAAFHA